MTFDLERAKYISKNIPIVNPEPFEDGYPVLKEAIEEIERLRADLLEKDECIWKMAADCENCRIKPRFVDKILIYNTLDIIEGRADEAMDIFRKHGFIFDDPSNRWQKLAFTLYSMLVDLTQTKIPIIRQEIEEIK